MTGDLKLTETEHAAMATRLHEAITAGKGIDPPSETTDFTFDDAYRIRRRLVDLLIADGGMPKGHKIGFTSEAMQKMYGMSGPDFGQLLDHMFVPPGRPVAVSGLCDTRVEPELAFEMAEPLSGPGVTVADALAATHRIWAAIEVIDSRVGAMRAAAVDSIADNAGAGRVILGGVPLGPNAYDLAGIDISITVDGSTEAGKSGDVMGSPAASLAWLANKLAEIDGLGGHIQPGDIILTGSPTRSMAVGAGSTLQASFGPLGEISAVFC